MIFVDPVKDLGPLLLDIDSPGRYTGGEHGRLAKTDALLQTLIAFPDLYEIGMSNQAFRIIYNGLNKIPGISCDRAFAPAPDFEKLLREKNMPLYGLDTGISLKSLDLLLFTLGYELGITGILTMLDVSGIPLRAALRGDDDPLIIAGGPVVSNPLPYSAFIDAFWIGEAENGFFDLASQLLEVKQGTSNQRFADRGQGARADDRAAMLKLLQAHPNVWMKGKDKAVRAVYWGFGQKEESVDDAAVYPVPGMKIVQHHGILEIMRGCPNGCRFCHAGFWYRPMRQKSPQALIREAESFITRGGYREISLSSLSTGDYPGIDQLVDALNDRFSSRHVSFALPSLKVSGFSLPLLEKVSRTRKSGLTFAIETPLDFWQLAINKQVSEDSVVAILHKAKHNGWRTAKFYFMIGLPVPPAAGSDDFSEENEIIHFVTNVGRKTGMKFNVNVGIFIPKPHTPYQWARQINGEAASAKLDCIRSRLKPLGHKVSISDPLISMIEGVLSRGDERAGELAEEAFHAGSRLDPWQEFIDKNAWQNILEKNTALVTDFLSAKDLDKTLPWYPIASGVSCAYLKKEFEKSNNAELTPSCAKDCTAHCGCCNTGSIEPNVRRQGSVSGGQGTEDSVDFHQHDDSIQTVISKRDPVLWKLLFSFSKEGSAVFHGHLSLVEIFSMAFTRAGLDVIYTQGYNPLAKLEIVSPLSVGISAAGEVAAVEFFHPMQPCEFMEKINNTLPEGIRINRAQGYCVPSGKKKHSLSSLLWGFGYTTTDGKTEYLPATEEKTFRSQCLNAGETRFSLRRSCVLAKNIINKDQGEWASYFDVYSHLYGS